MGTRGVEGRERAMTITLLASSVATSDLPSKIFFLISTRILVSAEAPGSYRMLLF